jgi:osmotically inducible protein OsmC
MADRSAQVTWEGDLRSGNGEIHEAPSGAFGPLQVTWASRSEDDHGGRTSPEELIAAAHASCFSMSLAGRLARAGHSPERLETSATVTFVPGTGITRSTLAVVGRVPGIDEAAFREEAEAAKEGCPVSAALKGNVELSLDARLAAE